MKLFKFKNMAMMGALSLAGVGLIGVGAHATFTQNTNSSQAISTGTLHVTLSGAGTLSNSNETLTLPASGNNGSTFTTGYNLVTMTNVGTLPAGEITSTVAVSGGSGLAAEAYACEISFAGPNQTLPVVIYNGTLSGLVGLTNITGTIAVSGTDGYSMEVYAGNISTSCGTVTTPGATPVAGPSGAPSLLDNSEGETITVSNTIGYSD